MSARGHILLVEDNEATRYAVSRILVNAGYRVTAAESGEDGLRGVAESHPDLVLLDVKLPDLSGFDVVRRLKAHPATSAMPVVHLSATSISTAEQVQGLEGGADAYLTHPIEPQVLVATLDALLRARRAESRYRKIFDTGLLGIVTWDERGLIVDANDTFLALVGHPRVALDAGELSWGRLVRAGPGSDDAPPPLAPGAGPVELELLRAGGGRVPVLVGRAGNGDHDDAVAFVLDISEQKRAEEALRDADRRKDHFIAVLSHELRNPLSPIRNSIAILDRVSPDSTNAVRARQILRRQTDHLTRLVDDLLDVTRIGRGKITLQRARVDLAEVVRRTSDDLRSMFEEARVTLRVERPGAPVWVDADATRLSQVVSNLLNNAAKFTLRGGAVTVTVAPAPGGGRRCEVRVRDTGIGIEPAYLAQMFEPFAQADRSLARTQGGLGLGLALVRGLVELHGGTVSARSEGPNRGSEFTVVLPVAEPSPTGAVRGEVVPAAGDRG